MFASTFVHGVTRVSRGPVVQFPETGTFHAVVEVECGPDGKFKLELFAKTEDALRVMVEDFTTPRQIDEVTR